MSPTVKTYSVSPTVRYYFRIYDGGGSVYHNRDGTKCDIKSQSPNENNENCICEFINAEYLEFDNEMVSTTCRHWNDTEIKIGDICPENTCYLNGCQDEALEYIENHLVQPFIISCFFGMTVYSLGFISIFRLIKQVIFQYIYSL